MFFVNIPIALITLVWALRSIPRDGPMHVGGFGGLVRVVDVVGVALFAVTVIATLEFLAGLGAPKWWLLAVIVAAGLLLVLWELRAAQPLIDVRMLAANSPLVRTYLRQMLAGLGSYTAMYGISQWMEQSAGYSAAQVGLILVPYSALSVVCARVNSTHGWVRIPLILTGFCFVGAGVTAVAIHHSSGLWVLLAMTFLFGVANGLSGYANQATLYTQSPPESIGVASGLYRTFMYFGAIFSSSLIGIAFGARATDGGLHIAGWAVVVIGAALIAMTVADRRIPRAVSAD